MKKVPLILVVVLVIGAGGILWLFARSQKPQSNQSPQPAGQQVATTLPGYQGKVLAGESSPYLEFSKADYQKALSEGKIVVLNFYANWCPICRVEQPEIEKGFNALASDRVIGFRVNFADSDTDQDEKDLADQFNIPYQHTKVILKNGQEVKRSGDQWNQQTFNQEVNSALE